MKPIKLKQDMEKYEDTNTLREEWLESSTSLAFFDTLPTVEDRKKLQRKVENWWLNKFNQKLEEIEEEISKLKPILWNDDSNRYIENVAKYNILEEALQIIKNKKN